MINLITCNEQDKVQISQDLLEDIKKIIQSCEEEEGIYFDNEISLTFVDDEKIQSLNKEHRNIDSATDVLSFPMYEKEDLDMEKKSDDKFVKLLGDIVISLEKAQAQALDYGHSFKREVCYLICHSMFHLMGYDHINEDDKSVMRAKEEKIMNKFNIIR